MEEVRKYMSDIGKRRFEGKTPAEVSKIMSEVRRKGIANKKSTQTSK